MIGIGLAMDAFSVSLANGLNDPCMRRRKMLLTAAVFGLFQGAMPLIGWFLVHSLAEQFSFFEQFIPWIALALLSFIGGKMLVEGIKESKECQTSACPVCTPKAISIAALLVQGVATSIDALSVGFTISEYGVLEAVVAALIIAAVTFVICLGGVAIGKKFGTALACKSAIFGGAVLIFVGIEIFVTSLF